jgi:hypothetical protein
MFCIIHYYERFVKSNTKKERKSFHSRLSFFHFIYHIGLKSSNLHGYFLVHQQILPHEYKMKFI